MTLITTDLLPTKTYPFQAIRYLFQQMGIQPGPTGPGDFLVTQRGAGANQSVDIAAGGAWVVGTTGTRQGIYHQVNDATINAALTAASGSNPRIDQVLLVVNDSSLGAGSDTPAIVVVAGTATSGATLVNRTGAVSDGTLNSTYPYGWLRLADILVPTSSTSVTTDEIKDRRPKTCGALSIAGQESITSASFITMPTPDIITELVVPTNGFIDVGYRGWWQESNSGGQAAIFVGTNQLKISQETISTSLTAVTTAATTAIGTTGINNLLVTHPLGLTSHRSTSSYTGDATTGQALGSYLENPRWVDSNSSNRVVDGNSSYISAGGMCRIFVAAGTYDISIKYLAAAGTVYASNRKLWAQVVNPNLPHIL